VSVEFPDGIVGIVGRNGSGKSSLVESIAWAIYGNESTIVRTGKEGVKLATAFPNDECSVTLQFELGGEEYRLQRAMKGARNVLDASLTVNGKLLAKGDSAVTEAMIDRLGMDHRAFFVSVFAKQKELNALSSLRSEERRKLIRRMLDIDVLDRVVVEIDKDARLIDSELKGLQASLLTSDGRPKRKLLETELLQSEAVLTAADASVKSLAGEMKMLEEKVETLKARRSDIGALQEKYRSAKEECTRSSTEAAGRERTLAALVADLDSLKGKSRELAVLKPSVVDYEQAVEERERMERSMRLSDEKKGIDTRMHALDDEVSRLKESVRTGEAELNGLGKPSERILTVEKNIGELTEQAKAASEGAKGKESEARRLSKDIESLRVKLKEVSTLGPDGQCPTCERTLGDHHAHLTRKLEDEVADKTAEKKTLDDDRHRLEDETAQFVKRRKVLEERRSKLIAEREKEVGLGSRVSGWNNQIADKERERERLSVRSNEIGEVGFEEERYKALKSRLITLKQSADAYHAVSAQMQRLPSLEADERKAREALAAAEQSMEKASELLAIIGYKEGDLEAAQSEVDRASSSAMAKSKELSAKRSELAAKTSEADGLKRQLDELNVCEERASDCSSRHEGQTALSEVMKEFKSEVIARITPALSQIASGLFSELTEGKYAGLELNDEYDIEVLDAGKKYELARFSGGEEDLANLCLRLAISKLITERAGSALNFLILDEIFGSQDQVRKRNIVNAFNQLSRQFSQIVLITHVDDVKDMLGGAIVVSEKEDGTSELTLVQ
jgi:exonuclease SbcC